MKLRPSVQALTQVLHEARFEASVVRAVQLCNAIVDDMWAFGDYL